MAKGPKYSAFSKEHWIAKGYSEEEAEFKRNSIRPIRKEYWMIRGYSEEQSIIKSKEFKDSNNKKGAKAAASRSLEEIRKTSPRCVEYWIKQGYSLEESKRMVSEAQTTFTIEKCIAKYGEEEGRKIWQDRQDRWQATLNAKSDKEKIRINKDKKYLDYNKLKESGLSDFDIIEKFNNSKNMNLVSTIEEFKLIVQHSIIENPGRKYYSPSKLYNKFPAIQNDMLGLTPEWYEQFCATSTPTLNKKGSTQSWTWSVEEGFLRSSFEIEFYNMCKSMNIEFMIDKSYPGSNFRYDFYFPKYNKYVEICPRYNMPGEKSYTSKMDKKKELFGCDLLTSIIEMKQYLERLNAINC